MSDAQAAAQAPAKKSPKLLVLALLAVLLLGAGGGGAWWFLHKGGDDDEETAAAAAKKHAAKPLFTTLEPFTVNLTDPRGERFAQVGITLQFEDPKIEAELKDRLPAIRNEILLLISSKQIEELLTLQGKQKLAQEIGLRTGRLLGVDLPDPPAAAASAASAPVAAREEAADEDEPKPKKKRKRKAPEVANPITGVLFSQFIVQ